MKRVFATIVTLLVTMPLLSAPPRAVPKRARTIAPAPASEINNDIYDRPDAVAPAIAPAPTRVATAAAPGSWIVEDATVRAELTGDGALRLADKRTGTKWEPVHGATPVVVVQKAAKSADGRQLFADLRIDGQPWQMTLALPADNAGSVDVTLSAPGSQALAADLAYPYGFRAPGADFRAVIPNKTGVMFSVQDTTDPRVLGKYDCYAGSGLSQPWYGFTDLQKGLMETLETPADCGMNLQLAGDQAAKVFAFQNYWTPSVGTVRYPRKMRISLFDAGGYVAMAKHYRQELIDSGQFVTLLQKARTRPQVAGLMGAMDLHIEGHGGKGSVQSVVQALEAKGVKHLLVNTDPSAISWLKSHGHLTTSYRIYTDMYRQSASQPAQRGDVARSRGFPQDAYTQKDGQVVKGFTPQTTYRSAVMQMPLMAQLVPPLLHDNGYDAIFMDVLTAQQPLEDYSPIHFIDRMGDMAQRQALLRYVQNEGVLVASEDGQAWAAPYVEYFEGMSMPRRFGMVKGVTIGNYPQGFDLTPEFTHITIGGETRVPLWDLVFHDSVVSTFRWNYTPDRFNQPQYWDQLDLCYMVNGDMPIMVINADRLNQFGAKIAQTYKNVCEWQKKIGWDELVDHRALTPDRLVQESRFSSGWAITVNFSPTKPYTAVDGSVIQPYSFKEYPWDQKKTAAQ